MIRIAWRQFRTAALVGLGALAVVAAIVVITRPHLVDLYDRTVATCADRGDCDAVEGTFLRTDRLLQDWLGIVVVVVPGLVGLFWGAPLVAKEIETGTFRLAWTQSITRRRWLAAKVGVVGLGAAVLAGGISLLVTWWAQLLDRVGQDQFGLFDRRDLVPVGHALFGFALGVTIGTVVRRVLPALAGTLVVFVAVRLGVTLGLRPRLLHPSTRAFALDKVPLGFGSFDGGAPMMMPEAPRIPNAWIVSTEIVDRSGRPLTPSRLAELCPRLDQVGPPRAGGDGPTKAPDGVVDVFRQCTATIGRTYHVAVGYQPAGRYWTLQWLEFGLYAAAALALVALCAWRIRRVR